MKKRYVVGAVALLLVGILTWWVLPGTPRETKQGTNTNAADKDLQAFYQVLEADYPQVYERLADEGKTTYTIPGLTQTPSVLADGEAAGEEEEAGDMTPQGMSVVGDYLAISAYSKSYRYQSVLWLLDRQTGAFVKTVVLPTASHVGGLAYDPDHERLWVTTTDKSSASRISAISLKDLEVDDFAKTGKPIAFTHDIDLAVVEKSSYMAYHDQALYVGYFDKENLGHVGYFALNDQGLPVHEGDEKDLYQPNAVYDTPEQIQGLAFLDDQLVLSQSYGNKDSKLLYFDLGDKDRLNNLTANQAVAELVTPAYMQQIVAEGDFIYLLFESSATQYRLNPTVTSIDRVIKIKK